MPATALVTSEQYLALPDEFDQHGNRIRDELIGGVIVKMSPASQLHNVVKISIVKELLSYLMANPQLELEALAEMAYLVSERDTLIPDASVIERSRLAPRKDKYISGSPDLAIEVVSASDTAAHLKAKVDAYLESGAKTVWIVYPDARSVMVHSRHSVREFKRDERIEDPLLPGFPSPISRFFALT